MVSTDQPEAPEVGHQTPETSDVDVVMIEAQASPSEQASGPSRHVDGQDAAKNGSIAISAGAEGDAQVHFAPEASAHVMLSSTHTSTRPKTHSFAWKCLLQSARKLSQNQDLSSCTRCTVRLQQTNGRAAEAGAPPTFSEAEDFVLAGDGGAADAEAFGLLRRETRARLSRIARLEQASPP